MRDRLLERLTALGASASEQAAQAGEGSAEKKEGSWLRNRVQAEIAGPRSVVEDLDHREGVGAGREVEGPATESRSIAFPPA